MIYVIKYGKWYYENEDYLKQFLSLQQGDLVVDEYSDQFSMLQEIGGFDENGEQDLFMFLRGLRPDILESMKQNHS